MGEFLLYYSLTLALESPFYLLGLTSLCPRDRVVLWLSANGLSYPFVYFWSGWLPFPEWGKELASEVWAPVSESVFARCCLPSWGRRETLIVVAANLFSWGVGRVLGW